MPVLSAPATTSVSNVHPAGTAVRKVQQHANFALLELSGHLPVHHLVINACPVQVEPALSTKNQDLKINVKRFVPKDSGQLLVLFLVHRAHTTITKIPLEAHQMLPASDAPVIPSLVLAPRQSTIARKLSIHQIQRVAKPDPTLLQALHPAILVKQAHIKTMLAAHLV